MLTFIKDCAALITLCAFTLGSLTWLDTLSTLL